MSDARLKVPPQWAVGAVVAGALGSFAFLLQSTGASGDLLVPIGRIVVTLTTGLWFSFRIHYTLKRGAPAPGFVSLLFTAVIALAGLSCFLLITSTAWFASHAAALALGAQKDLEVSSAQKVRAADPKLSRAMSASAQLISSHHLYSVLRDLSLSFWWLIYGLVLLRSNAHEHDLILAFGLPYILLVVFWGILKDRVDRAEDQLEAAVDERQSTVRR